MTDEIRGPLVSQNVSAVSADPAVRAVFTERQRSEAAHGDVVLEGRDTGTVVFPDADLKVYLVASIEERARRRQRQLEAQGVFQPVDQLMADIGARDAYDSGRELAPLRKAEDAVEIDTTGMTIAEVIEAVCALAVAARPSGPSAAATLEERGPSSMRAGQPYKWRLSRMVRSPLDTLLYRFAYSFIPPLWRLLYRMEISGREHFPPAGPVVLASNHRSNLDPFFLGASAPRQIHFMAKAELWKVGALGWLIDKLGAFPINRGEADRQAVRKALDTLAAGAVLGIFPEGSRQRQGGFGDIHPGVTLFSLREGVVTIPVVMEGTERIMRGRMIRFPKVRVAFGPPPPPSRAGYGPIAESAPREQPSHRSVRWSRRRFGRAEVSPLTIRLSECAGFCWGVERALEVARNAAAEAPGPVNTLGPLIHNPGVIADLKQRGVGVVSRTDELTSGTVILRSHGVPKEIREELATADLNVLDATCRFVTSAQDKAARLLEQGYLVVIVGEKDHPEVLALRSYAGSESLVAETPQRPAR